MLICGRVYNLKWILREVLTEAFEQVLKRADKVSHMKIWGSKREKESNWCKGPEAGKPHGGHSS